VNTPAITPQQKRPEVGEVVRIRTRTYLVESVQPSPGTGTLVRMACLDDDAQGQPLEVVWELELDPEILDREAWQSIGKRGFDNARHFSAYIHTLRWNCVTATDPRIFQSPFRAGIRLDAYQLEPLRKALLLPRVNLFIADDVGLGKTIEAALIASELLLRRRVREILVACPPSMVPQWKDELEARFGLTFEVLDRAYLERIRQERGYGVNPWTTFPRFLISHKLLIDETYTGPLRDWLDNLRPGSLLIFDEAHHAAPSSGAKYAIDSRITRAIRDLAPRFEHRLFLSATPHNGHSNSFSALLALLDSQRFTPGVPVLKSQLDAVMVRRLKEDLRELIGGFPKREPVQVDISGLPPETAELKLSKLLDQYRQVRQLRMAGATKRKQAEAALLVSHLQQRLLSSIEAFARTLAVHRRTMERIWAQVPLAHPMGEGSGVRAVGESGQSHASRFELLSQGLDIDDDRSQLSEEDQGELLAQEVEAATAATAGNTQNADVAREKALLAEMEKVAELARGLPDARVRYLLDWIRKKMCPGVAMPVQASPQPGAKWNDLRLLIFTEYDDTRRYLVEMLRAAIADTDLSEYRIEVYHGPTPPDKREAIKRAFNEHPQKHPVRILVATDAAREGINLQAHCHNLFHFDVPWNPSRLEQRNGRIDRKLQPSPEVFCHYFVYTQRPEDRVLRALVRKTETIRRELGSLAQVLEERLAQTIRVGIRHDEADKIAAEIENADLDADKRATAEEELETARERQKLQQQIDLLRNRINDASKWIGLDMDQLRDTLSCSLELLGAEPLKQYGAGVSPARSGGIVQCGVGVSPASSGGILPPESRLVASNSPADGYTGPTRYVFPNLETRHGADPSWSATLDTLRALPDDGQTGYQWRKESPIRPVVFTAPEGIDDDIVQLHLQHRVVQRLLGRFLAQGFVHHDLSRACLAHTSDAIPRVVLLGRLSLYGAGAVRLHEEILTVKARWTEPASRRGTLSPYAREAEAKTLELLESSLRPGAHTHVPEVIAGRLQSSMPRGIEDLLPHLEKRGQEAQAEAETKLKKRGDDEADSLRRVLEDQRRRVESELGRATPLLPGWNELERCQLESNRRYWDKWLANVEGDLQREPNRVRQFYQVASFRIEPVGLAYLWPVTG
jgi:SNF2 family DNA or RNA helicase